MNDGTPLDITEAAGDWLDRLGSNTVSTSDRSVFAKWLRTSPVHVSEFLQLSAMRAELSGTFTRHPDWVDELLEGQGANVIEWAEPEQSTDAVQPVAPRTHRWASFAALTVLAVSAWFAYTNLIEVDHGPEIIATALGEQRSILLSDGSTLELNTETEVRIRITDSTRDIDLLRGEILVDVTKDPDRPFRVLSDGVVARAIGTRFNVYRRSEDTVVTVIEGRVAVNQSSTAPPSAQQAVGTNTEPVELTAGLQLALVNTSTRTLAAELAPEPANLAKATAWTERRLVFDDEPLSAIVAEFNRYNRSRLIVSDVALSEKRLSGVFDANDPDEFIALLQSLERIDIQHSANGHRTIFRVETTNSEQQVNF